MAPTERPGSSAKRAPWRPAPTTRSAATESLTAFADYVRAQENIRSLDDGGGNDLAVGVALSSGAEGGLGTAQALDAAFTDGIHAAQVHFDDAAGEARRGFSSLAVAVLTFGLALAVVLALVGLQRRIGEYR